MGATNPFEDEPEIDDEDLDEPEVDDDDVEPSTRREKRQQRYDKLLEQAQHDAAQLREALEQNRRELAEVRGRVLATQQPPSDPMERLAEDKKSLRKRQLEAAAAAEAIYRDENSTEAQRIAARDQVMELDWQANRLATREELVANAPRPLSAEQRAAQEEYNYYQQTYPELYRDKEAKAEAEARAYVLSVKKGRRITRQEGDEIAKAIIREKNLHGRPMEPTESMRNGTTGLRQGTSGPVSKKDSKVRFSPEEEVMHRKLANARFSKVPDPKKRWAMYLKDYKPGVDEDDDDE